MRMVKKLGLLSVASVSAIAFASQAQAVDVTGDASAEIQESLTLVQDTAMDFATIIADSTGDTITLDTADSVSATGASTFTGTAASGEFSATGTPSAAVTISFSTGNTLAGPGAAMGLGSFTNSAGGSPAFDGSGDLNFTVGADLTVNAGQAGGTYTGTYTLTVDYQ
ncbi:MAG: DUF4402 domain-containing protein [Alphaproteobacteria bacterium]